MKIKQRLVSVGKPARKIGGFLVASVREWSEDRALRHAAALAYYSIFALAPLLVIAIALAGFFFGEQAVEGEIVTQLQDYVGTEVAVFIENMLREVRQTGTGLWPTIISIGTTLFGALVIFSALQDVLNMIWGVQPDPDTGIWYTIRRRALAFAMILLFGALVMAAFLFSTAFSVAETYWEQWFGVELDVWGLSDQVVWLVFFTAAFSLIYKFLPDVKMAWRDLWAGAFMTSLLFTVGIYAISTYLAYSGVANVFGAAGTLVVLLVWIYYSWIIVLMGAEMTQVWARRFGHGIKPGKNAQLRVQATRTVKGKVTKSGVEEDEEEDKEEVEQALREDGEDDEERRDEGVDE